MLIKYNDINFLSEDTCQLCVSHIFYSFCVIHIILKKKIQTITINIFIEQYYINNYMHVDQLNTFKPLYALRPTEHI